VFTMRVTDQERDAFEAAARRAGKPVTQWARERLMTAATTEPESSAATGR
jgi:hypothetical protein